MRTAPILATVLGSLLAGCGAASAGPADRAHGDHADGEHARGEHAHGDGDATAYVHHGDHASHRFDDPEEWAARFEDPSRDAWQRPDAVLDALQIARDARVADIGSATGYFPVRIARRVPNGRVWGVDVEPGMVRYLNARARREGLDNLFSVLGTASDPLLPEPVDLVLIVNTYHHIQDRPAYFASLLRDLRPSGRVAIVDFKMGELPVGPPDSAKIPPEAIEREMTAAGYRLAARDPIELPHQHVLVFER